jgi:predicted membrane protein
VCANISYTVFPYLFFTVLFVNTVLGKKFFCFFRILIFILLKEVGIFEMFGEREREKKKKKKKKKEEEEEEERKKSWIRVSSYCQE